MNKITISNVSEEIFNHKGFDARGCYGSSCNDACCKKGCDMDRESYELILQHREAIEKRLGFGLEQCMAEEWSNQDDFLGNNMISTTVVNGTCAFHRSAGKGCVLWQMVMEENCSRRIVPSICRLYPVTWDNGALRLFDGIETTCNCLERGNCGTSTLWDTQKEAIDDIFLIKR